MPRSKLGKSSVLFGIEPWQDKGRTIDREEHAGSESVDFIAVADSVSSVEDASIHIKRPRAEMQTPWIRKPLTEGSDVGGQPTNGLQPACDGLGDIGDRIKTGSEAGMEPTELELEDKHPSIFNGTCFLAVLPSGHMSGHIVESCSYNCEPLGRTLGLVARCVASSSGRPGCMEDNDTDFLRVTILNLQTDEEAEALVSKTGGDMARLAPAESWQIMKYMGIANSIKVEEAMQVQVTFVADQLFEGEDAEKQLRSFNQRKLLGREAVVNIGQIKIIGLRPGFT